MVAFVRDLDPTRPTPVELLGQRLVLWRDGAGAWRCFQDRCPHRPGPGSFSAQLVQQHPPG